MQEKELKNYYENWNVKKQDLNFSNRTNKIYFKEGDIWWCSVGMNIGAESFGKGPEFMRPVLIYKKLSSDLFIGLPLSSKYKVGTWFCEITFQNEIKNVLLYQIRTFHKKRFQRKLGELDKNDLNNVKKKLESLLKFVS